MAAIDRDTEIDLIKRVTAGPSSFPVRAFLVTALLLILTCAAFATGLREEPAIVPGVSVPRRAPPIHLPEPVVRIAVLAGDTSGAQIRDGVRTAISEINARTVDGGLVVLMREELAGDPAVDLQIGLLEQAMVRGANAILLDPVDREGLTPYVRNARDAGVAVVTMRNEVGADGERLADFHVATNVDAATATVVDELVRYIGTGRTVALVSGDTRRDENRTRRNGLLRQLRARHPAIRILDPIPEGVVSEEAALSVVTGLLAGGADLAAIIATDARSTVGVAQGVSITGRGGEVVVVGFDPTQVAMDLLRRGALNGILVEDPYTIGYLSVFRALDALRGIDSQYVVEVPYRFIGPETAR